MSKKRPGWTIAIAPRAVPPPASWWTAAYLSGRDFYTEAHRQYAERLAKNRGEIARKRKLVDA